MQPRKEAKKQVEPPKDHLLISNRRLEVEIVGALLIAGDHAGKDTVHGRSIGAAFAYLMPGDFVDERCQRLFRVLQAMHDAGEVWWPIGSMMETLRETEPPADQAGTMPRIDAAWLSEIAIRASFPPSLLYYSKQLRACHVRRRMSLMAEAAWQASESGRIEDVLPRIAAAWSEVQSLAETINVE